MLLLDGKQFNKYLYFGRSLYCFILTFYNIEAVEDFLGASQTEVKKITRLVIVFGGHEVLLQNYWMESWLEWAFLSPILDYELPSRETGGNKHRPKIVLFNAVLFKYCLGLKRPEGDIGDCIQKITQLSLDFIQLCLSAVVSCGWLFTSLIFKLAIQPMDNYL